MTQYETLLEKIEANGAMLREILVRMGAAPPHPPTDPVAPIGPPLPIGPNPFVAWKAEGLSLLDVILFRLHRGMSPAEWDQAVAAGYPRDNGLQPVGSNDKSGFDLSGKDDGDFVRNVLTRGIGYSFTWRPHTGAQEGYFQLVSDAVQVGVPEPLSRYARISITNDEGLILMSEGNIELGGIHPTPRFGIDPRRTYYFHVFLIDGNLNVAVEARTK